MWLHVCLLAGTAALALLIRMGKIPYQDILTPREWRLLILLLLAGNLLGAGLTYTRNQDLQWEEGMYFERPAAGEGRNEEEMDVKVGEEKTSVYVQVPEQEGEEDTGQEDQEEEGELPGLEEQILQDVEDYNQQTQERDRYYLPAYLDGDSITWSRPWDTSGGILAALCVVGACCVPIQRQRAVEQKRQEKLRQLLLDYPNLVTRLALLLEAGMTVRKAVEKIALDYKKKRTDGIRHAYEELLKSYYEMESGVMEERAYENFGKRCGHPKYRTLATLLVQNLKKGNRKLLETLEQESTEAFEERKRYARVQGDTAATKLLVPMVLMLLVVLVILIVPACMSFYSS